MSANAADIRKRMEVVGNDGGHVGTVQGVHGDQIKLAQTDDPDGTGRYHHFVPMSMVDGVAGQKVRLNVPADRAKDTSTLVAGKGVGTPRKKA